VSLHGANRLGSNSTAECLVWGAIAGKEVSQALPRWKTPVSASDAKVKAAGEHIAQIESLQGNENLYDLRRELRSTMDRTLGVYRTGADIQQGLNKIREIKQRAQKAPVRDKAKTYNSNLFHALELENLVELAEVTAVGALAREESRGAHARRDFSTRDDTKFLRHTLAWRTASGPRLDYKPVTINTWKPVERKY
jgi:succinate dehydrogenase / fumarate reductase flavoprotein subunit